MSEVKQEHERDVAVGELPNLPESIADRPIANGSEENNDGNLSNGGDHIGSTVEVTTIKEVEESLAMLELNHKEVEEEAQSTLLNLELEEIDTSNTRECPPIVLIAGDRHEIRPYNNRYTIRDRFLLPAKVKKWAVVILFDDRVVMDVDKGLKLFDEIQGFASRYVEIGLSKGVSIEHIDTIQFVPSLPSITNTVETMSKEDLKSELQKLLVKLNDNLIDHAIIILPDNCPFWVHGYLQYLETNKWGSVKRPGINLLARTSRMQYETLMRLVIRSRDRGKAELIPHIWLKYNMKLGGVNIALKHTFDTHSLKFLNDSSLILSIDLCRFHETSQDGLKSAFRGMDCVSAVGMWNLASSKMSFRSQTRVQRNDIAVVEVDLLVRDIILSYKQRNGGQLPTSIIIFRSATYQNGVMEVARKELTPIKKMLTAEWGKHDAELPTLTYLRVPKTKRFSKSDRMRPTNLIQTGSLVDSIMSNGGKSQSSSAKVNQEDELDNTLQPFTNNRQVLKVYDENNLSKLAIRAMVHSLSYLSPRTTSRTRPTPIDLADLANERTRHICYGWLEDNGDKYNDDREGMMSALNHFLTEEMGDEEYKNTLYYA